MVAVRAELAAVLLQSKKYDDAAREYRALLARDDSNTEYRLGLARALAWGDHPREAEIELRALQAKRVQPATVDSLLKAVRDAMEPRAAEAATWVAERRDYAPYRLAYARAAARERYTYIASAQYDTLIARIGTSNGRIPDVISLRLEQARALIDGRELFVGAARLQDVLRATPADTAVRHELANVLFQAHRPADARAQFDTLISRAPTSDLLVERANLRLDSGDRAGGENDLRAAIDLSARPSAYIRLGNIYRERGDYAAAEEMYRGALDHRRHGDNTMAIRASIAELRREQRPVAAFVPAIGDEPGVRIASEGVSDNLGVHYVSSTVGGAIPLGDVASIGVSALHQYMSERSALRSLDLNAYGGTGTLASQLEYGPFLGRLGIAGGAVKPPESRSIPVGRGTLGLWLNAWELAADVSTGPAYPSLLTVEAIRDVRGNEDVLTEHTVDGSLGGPIGPADVAISADRSRLSDGNERNTMQAFVRVPIAPAVSVVYMGNRTTFAKRSLRYWDPLNYFAHSAGLEVASRPLRGLSWSVRALPGMAWSKELPPPPIVNGQLGRRPTNVLDRSAFQLSTTAELVWHQPHWDGTAGASYGIGRVGDYQRFGLTLGARVTP